MIEIQATFINLARHVHYNKKFLAEQGLDGFLTVNISDENLEITDAIEQAIKDVLHASLTKQDTKEAA